jgi:predicted nucleotidyltransferase
MLELIPESNQNRLARRIAGILRTSTNQSFSFYQNEALTGQIAIAMARHITATGVSEIDAGLFAAALEKLDFLLVAELLDSIINTERRQWLNALLDGNKALLYEHQMERLYQVMQRYGETAKYAHVEDLPSVFNGEIETGYLVYWAGSRDEECLSLFEDAKWHLRALIDAQTDLPGINSLVREGLVKSLTLPTGRRVITKRNNPSKQGRFLSEQYNVSEIVSRLGLPTQQSFVRVGSALHLQVIRPFAVVADCAEGAFYSFSNFEVHPTLEYILLTEKDAEKRHQYMSMARQVLEHLYSNGIVWGDMAPRNILVQEDGGITTFLLLDFEKTAFTDGVVPMTQRLEHARGPMCVEEFGAVCSLPEVVQCFDGYFDPADWNEFDASPIPFAKPKREVMDILKSNGCASPTIGQYNKMEGLMIEVRFPFVGEDDALRLPLHTSFKVDHYLGAEYDRRTTELFMKAKSYGYLTQAVDALNAVLQGLETEKILSQVEARLNITKTEPLNPSASRLAAAIDLLYESGKDSCQFKSALRKLSIREHFHSVRAKFQLAPSDGQSATRSNWREVERHLNEFITQHNSATSDSEVLIVLYGGAARHEFTGQSDLDVAVISEDRIQAQKVEQAISQFAQDEIGIPVELFPRLALSTLQGFILANPDCFLDFYHGRVVSGGADKTKLYIDLVAECLFNKDYREKVQSHYRNTLVSNNPSIKQMLNSLHAASAFDLALPEKLKDVLLSVKCEECFVPDGFQSFGYDRKEVENRVKYVLSQLA